MYKLSIVLLISGLLVRSASWAQVDRANVSGTITDSSSAVIIEVNVSIESAETGFRLSTVSNGVGAYLLPAVPVGTSTLSFGKAGFQTKKYDKLALTVGQTRTLNLTLDIGATATQIDVAGEADTLVQNNAEIGLVVDQRQVRSLPMNGRNWSGFLMLAPGETNTGDGSQNSVRFNGRGRDENNFTFDGVDATGVKDPRQEANLRLSISLDSIAEFRVSSGLYNAESGNGAGAQMNLVSKSGTNQFHGSAFEFFRNDKLDARRPIDSAGKPPFRLNQFGANVGGPIFKDKTFFFANYEGLRQRLAVTNNGTVPSEAFKARAIAASPAIRPVMEAYKPGTARGADANIDQLVTVGAQPWEENSGLIKVDHRFTPATSLFVRYNIDDGLIDEVRNALLETRTSRFRTQICRRIAARLRSGPATDGFRA